ncbi:unnamed protein product [Dibothriocephalus latus]|uniref:Uncharacterized protein n=1 Tax=Dibothriocephalus latus TaxID=60516 RepID=A0A3P6P6D6_DIBLA|nr:unnamed protein product [Dibothriocephalus latus]
MTHLATFGGETVSKFADQGFAGLLSDEITYKLTFYGRQQAKQTFIGSSLYELVLGKSSIICSYTVCNAVFYNKWNVDRKRDFTFPKGK